MNLFKINIDTKRTYGLDILRAFAILFVVYDHGINQIGTLVSPTIYSYFVFDGVSIFFVLSGFLIGGILIKLVEKREATIATLFNFWIRRWFRTVPNYFLIAAILVLIKVSLHHDFNIFSVKRYFLFLQNFNTPHPDFFPEAWSLSIEEWFYILFPITFFSCIYFFKLKKPTAIIIVALVFIGFSTWIRCSRYAYLNVNDYTLFDKLFRKQVITRLDSITFGVIGAYLFYYYETAWLRYKKLLFVVGIFLLISPKIMQLVGFENLFYAHVFSFTVASLGALALLPYLNDLKSGGGYLYKLLTQISLISYSLYLIHLSLIQGMLNMVPYPAGVLKYLIYWVVSVFGATLLYKYFEVPVMKLRDRFF